MVELPAIVLAALVLGVGSYMWWVHHVLNEIQVSGDAWYMRQFAFTNLPITAPYRWRPLLPWLAGLFGFRTVTFLACAVTPFIIYYYVGGGWAGFCVASMFVMNGHIFQFNIKNPEYCDGLGHALFAGAIASMAFGSWIAFPLFFLCALTRETLTAALGLIAVFVEPLLLIPLACGAGVALVARKECKDNQHPLIEDTYYGTVARWARNKGWKAFQFPHTILPLRGVVYAVPFMWFGVDSTARLFLLGLLPVWLLAVPASGQSRIMCYGFVLFAPFVAAIPQPWLFFFALFVAFWPIDWSIYDECGDSKFGYVHR